MTGKTYTFTVRRSRLVLAVAAVFALVGTLALFGEYAWLVNAGLLFLTAWLIHQARRFGGRRSEVVTHVVEPSDGQLVADAIQDASIREWVLRDMGGRR